MIFFASQVAAQDQSLDEAARLDSLQKCDEAFAIYQKALAAAPSSTAVLNNLGNHYMSCNAAAEAQATFARLLKLKPHHTNANLQLARLALINNQGVKALHFLAAIDPGIAAKDLDFAFLRAAALAQTGSRAAAEALVKQIAAQNNNNVKVLYALGMTCARLGFYSDAENAFAKVLTEFPADFEVTYNFALAAARNGHGVQARTAFESALKEKPDDVDSLYELGRVETASGDYPRAVYLLAQAAKAAAGRSEIQLALARASQMGGFYGDSLAAYDRYLAAKPDDEAVKRDRALVVGSTRSGQSAGLAYLDSYVAKHPADAIGFYDLAQLSYRANRTSALAEVSMALRLDPHLTPAFFFRAWLLNKAGRYADSLRDAETAARLNARDARALDLVGLDNLELAKPAIAEKPLRAALKLAPAEPDILFHLGRALLEQGRPDEARPILAEFQKTREKWVATPREEAGVVESATLSPRELAQRVVADYREAVQANPNEAALRLNLGRALFAAHEPEQALAAFRQLLDMSPSAVVSAEAGQLLLREEHFELACDFLKRSAEALPETRIDLAAAHYFKGELDSALAALALVPESAAKGDAAALKGLVQAAQGKPFDALKLVGAANPQIVAAAARLLADHGEPVKALAMVEQTRQRSTDDARLAFVRAALLARLNRWADANVAIKDLEARWPDWDRPYLAEALMLQKIGRTANAMTRFAIGAALGPDDPSVQCLRSPLANEPGTNLCQCAAGPLHLWIGGCLR